MSTALSRFLCVPGGQRAVPRLANYAYKLLIKDNKHKLRYRGSYIELLESDKGSGEGAIKKGSRLPKPRGKPMATTPGSRPRRHNRLSLYDADQGAGSLTGKERRECGLIRAICLLDENICT